MCQSSLGQRLREARESATMQQKQAAEAIGVKSQHLYNWEKGLHEPDRETLLQLWRLYKCDLTWLMTGAGHPKNESSTLGVSIRTERGRPVSRMEQAMAVLERIPEQIRPLNVHTYFDCGPRTFVIDINDRSNSPNFEPGDAVAIDPDETPRPGDMVFAAIKPDDHPVLRRYTVRTAADASKYVELQPLNSAWEADLIRSPADGRIIGVMTEHVTPRR
jgi:SOS-response transcriptional repressor LexA